MYKRIYVVVACALLANALVVPERHKRAFPPYTRGSAVNHGDVEIISTESDSTELDSILDSSEELDYLPLGSQTDYTVDGHSYVKTSAASAASTYEAHHH